MSKVFPTSIALASAEKRGKFRIVISKYGKERCFSISQCCVSKISVQKSFLIQMEKYSKKIDYLLLKFVRILVFNYILNRLDDTFYSVYKAILASKELRMHWRRRIRLNMLD